MSWHLHQIKVFVSFHDERSLVRDEDAEIEALRDELADILADRYRSNEFIMWDVS